mmetsp:Transcript_10832/g.22544  ORF Transcript_10832/g.22544 Transcript_10832/m.22544 type:complete len:223 (-) Transcript_10832:302-970(-)
MDGMSCAVGLRRKFKHKALTMRTSTFSASMIGCESTRRTGRAACASQASCVASCWRSAAPETAWCAWHPTAGHNVPRQNKWFKTYVSGFAIAMRAPSPCAALWRPFVSCGRRRWKVAKLWMWTASLKAWRAVWNCCAVWRRSSASCMMQVWLIAVYLPATSSGYLGLVPKGFFSATSFRRSASSPCSMDMARLMMITSLGPYGKPPKYWREFRRVYEAVTRA